MKRCYLYGFLVALPAQGAAGGAPGAAVPRLVPLVALVPGLPVIAGGDVLALLQPLLALPGAGDDLGHGPRPLARLEAGEGLPAERRHGVHQHRVVGVPQDVRVVVRAHHAERGGVGRVAEPAGGPRGEPWRAGVERGVGAEPPVVQRVLQGWHGRRELRIGGPGVEGRVGGVARRRLPGEEGGGGRVAGCVEGGEGGAGIVDRGAVLPRRLVGEVGLARALA